MSSFSRNFAFALKTEQNLAGRSRRAAIRGAGSKKRLSLALQGGGSFGAFTWGVLDRLLDDETIVFDVISGASAGAVNATLVAAGLTHGGRRDAQQKLEVFWKEASDAAPRTKPGIAMDMASRVISPYQFNPFNLNPLRSLLEDQIDFAALRQKPAVRLLIATTRVRDGQLRIFREKALSIDVLLASTCLPMMQQAVSIEGEAYWDGGYAANPPIIPLITATRAPDALVVQIMPSVGAGMPTTSPEIVKRLEQITFNASLIRDMDAITAMTKVSEDAGATALSRKLQRLRVHHIAAEAEFPTLSQSSGMNLDWDFLLQLRDAGRTAADRWLTGSTKMSVRSADF
jgi:NTE family protein